MSENQDRPARIECPQCSKSYLCFRRSCPHCGHEAPEEDRQARWDRRWINLCKAYAGWSKDPSTQVGSVLVRETNIQISQGYNGFPRGVEDHVELYNDKPTKYLLVVHAELNAILASRESTRGSTIYVWPLPPCPDCTKAIIQAGVRCIVLSKNEKTTGQNKWADSFRTVSFPMLVQAGVLVRYIDE